MKGSKKTMKKRRHSRRLRNSRRSRNSKRPRHSKRSRYSRRYMKGGVNTPPQENPQENRPNLLSDLPPDMTRSVCQFLGVKAGKIKCVNTEQKNLFEEIAKNTNLELNADVILTDEQIEKFKSQGIKIKLLETYLLTLI